MTRYFTHGLALMLADRPTAIASASGEAVKPDMPKANDDARLAILNYESSAVAIGTLHLRY